MQVSLKRHNSSLEDRTSIRPTCSPHKISFLNSVSSPELHRSSKRPRLQFSEQENYGSQNGDALNYFSPSTKRKSLASYTSPITNRRKAKRCKPGEKTFTLEEVKKIVDDAVTDREQELRAQYNDILHQRLREQFESFTKFNQDYVARQTQRRECTYLS